ncbi:glycoside hydrolase family 99-like domain-containing protein [Halarcobacter sp.]|uniref:glycoside hydrolase family 99-like domain-containing protein n=1 Tax=Halarcobacter sp. TaxID=2321133 RepID=UPI0029F5AAE3|nr:glycoside hydrolase family 99-like domain-containing protein [Halarcobacter sp.]
MKKNNLKARVIAFYLPQFHPIPENNQWWGKGFTEWTNVGKAKPLYEGHKQPKVPADLGYYDLRLNESRIEQAELAKQYGIEAFCYWHYWFGKGKQLLEKPFKEVLKVKKPDISFCLGWANQTWSGVWHGSPNRILIEQTYPGLEDYKEHFYSLLDAFKDKRYMKINEKLVFLIYNPIDIPNALEFTNYWQTLAKKEGLKGFHFIAHFSKKTEKYGCQSCVEGAPFATMEAQELEVQKINNIQKPTVYSYKSLVQYSKNYKLGENEYPLVMPNWDNTPRCGSSGIVLDGSTPKLFKEIVDNAIEKITQKYSKDEEKIIFLKAWNEWAEGNYMEPDLEYGHQYLEVLLSSLLKDTNKRKQDYKILN